MTRWNKHHIVYEGDYDWPDFTVDVTWSSHRVISYIQLTKATPGKLRQLDDLIDALSFEKLRMKMELQSGLDLRMVKPRRKDNE